MDGLKEKCMDENRKRKWGGKNMIFTTFVKVCFYRCIGGEGGK